MYQGIDVNTALQNLKTLQRCGSRDYGFNVTPVRHIENGRFSDAELGTIRSTVVIGEPIVNAVLLAGSQHDVLNCDIGMGTPDAQVPASTQ